jgi:hypothetical protein
MHCWPEEDNSRDRSPASNNLKALLARRRQFEGPKPSLKYLEGTAGLKKIIRGTKAHSKHHVKNKFVQRTLRMIGQCKESTKTSKKTQQQKVFWSLDAHTSEI